MVNDSAQEKCETQAHHILLPVLIVLAFLFSYAILAMDFLSVSIAIFLAILVAAGTNISIFRPSTFRGLTQKDQEKSRRYIKICIYSTVSGFFISILAFVLRYAEVSQLRIILSVLMLICLLLSCFTVGMLVFLAKQGEQ